LYSPVDLKDECSMCKLVLGFVKTLVDDYQVRKWRRERECSNDDIIITSLFKKLFVEAD
jgi:hypothetical protein